jgi:FkbM family methyltransferase
MLTFLRERESLWDRLARTDRPLVLYGTGDGADKILARLARIGRTVDAVYVSDDHARGQVYAGLAVRPLSELLDRAEKGAFDGLVAPLVLVAFASERPEVLARIRMVAAAYETVAPHVPLFAEDTALDADWLAAHEAELQYVYDHLADDWSRRVFADMLDYKLSGRLSYLWDAETERSGDLRLLFSFGPGETYADLGAYDGDTVREFQALCGGNYQAIYAFEPDPKNYAKLTVWAASYGAAHPGAGPVHCVHAAAGAAPGTAVFRAGGGRQSSLLDTGAGRTGGRRRRPKETELPVESVDHVLGPQRLDYAKLDVEGVEAATLRGMAAHLVPDGAGRLPKLLVAAYHHDEDLFCLPMLMWQLQPAYRIYLRKHPYVPAWEINLFAK